MNTQPHLTRDLIVFGEDWGGLPSSTQHLIRHIKQHHPRLRILWINSIGLRKPKLTLSDAKRAISKLGKALSALTKYRTNKSDEKESNTSHNLSNSNGILVHTLFAIPAPTSKCLRLIVGKILSLQLRSLIQRHALNQPILWTSLPTASDMFDAFPELPLIYYCGDDFNGLAGVDHATANLHEARISQQSQLLITASNKLSDKFQAYNPKLLSHGVDYALFSRPHQRAIDLPDNNKPTAGFYGSLSDWLDTELLCEIAQIRNDWNFVFIGAEHTELSALKRLKNCFFLGPKAHDQLPSYSQHWQASLLPFKNNAQIRSCNPLKLKEYLAAGSNIIATPFPALQPFRRHLNIITTAKQFGAALDACIQAKPHHHTTEKKQACRNSVAQESWPVKARQVEQWMAAL